MGVKFSGFLGMEIRLLIFVVLLNVYCVFCLSSRDSSQQQVLNFEEPQRKEANDPVGAIEPPSCVMSDWTDWSLCTGQCGSQIRRRLVLNKPEEVKKCPPTEQVRFCQHNASCANVCIYSPWSSWYTTAEECLNHYRERVLLRKPTNSTCANLEAQFRPKQVENYSLRENLFILQDLMRQYSQEQVKVLDAHSAQLTKLTASLSPTPTHSPDQIPTKKPLTTTKKPPATTNADKLLAELKPLQETARSQTQKYQKRLEKQKEIASDMRVEVEMLRLIRLQEELNADIENPQTYPTRKGPRIDYKNANACMNRNGDTRRYVAIQSYVPPVQFAPVMSEEVF
eukprot:TRINITY_DN3064_c0_g1_i2.p1 TRINITY_DN3064_c0_g1~~TRINITY_DN3064_c0_g1_i2.p1  ORF type:complete len:350 (+),score=65.13 TRINITY_DN3064_c0_g1_i2:33-1052(+)